MSAPQYCNRANIPHNNQNLGIASGPSFERRKILMDSHPYSYETSIFTLGALHEEVQGRQTKLHQGFSLGKLVQPSRTGTIFRNCEKSNDGNSQKR